MNGLKVILDGDGCWPDLVQKADEGKMQWLSNGADISLAVLNGGMTSGLASVAIRINLPDGNVVIAETSMRLFLAAAQAFRVRFGDQGYEKKPQG